MLMLWLYADDRWWADDGFLDDRSANDQSSHSKHQIGWFNAIVEMYWDTRVSTHATGLQSAGNSGPTPVRLAD